jgi:hypothetical protein
MATTAARPKKRARRDARIETRLRHKTTLQILDSRQLDPHVLEPAPRLEPELPIRDSRQRPTGYPGRLWQFGDGEEHGDVLQGVQGVPRLGNDQQVAVAPFPLDGVSNKAYPTMQHVHGRLAGVLVF